MATLAELQDALVNADKAGATEDARMLADAIMALKQPGAKPEGFGESLERNVRDIPRQVGLTARAGLEGVGNTLDFLATPFRAGLNAVVPPRAPTMSELVAGKQPGARFQPGALSSIADMIGLPKPQTPTERVAQEGAQMLAGTAAPLAAFGKLAQGAEGAGRSVLQALSARPDMQLTSGAGAGLLGGYAKETGAGPLGQFAASLAGGLAAPAGVAVAQKGIGAAQRAGESIRNAVTGMSTPPNVQVDVVLTNALRDSGMNFADLPAAIRNQLRNDVAQAMEQGPLDSAALRRLADYRLIGATPMRGNLTLDPGDITRQKNFGKRGINSEDPALQAIAQTENANNRALIEALNQRGANAPLDPYATGQTVIGALRGTDDAARASIGGLYDQARETGGRSAGLDPSAFTQRANDLLDQSLLGGKLPADVRNMMNWIATGQKPVGMHGSVPMPFNVDIAEQLKTRIGDLQRASNDRAERMALGLVRKALDDAPLASNQQLGQQSIDAFNRARQANREYMQTVDRTPALAAVRDGIEPDKFVQQFIIGNGGNANVMDLAALRNAIAGNAQAESAIRGTIAAHLKQRALNMASDEVGSFSQSAYNKALQQIGDRKLSMFFTPEEVRDLHAIGRVASYEQVQPKGAAVNNSNTGGAVLAGFLDSLGKLPLLRKIPMGAQLIGNPAASVAAHLQAGPVRNIPRSILAPRESAQPFFPLAPMIGAGGLLSSGN